MYRISVTTIEKFRRYMADLSSFDSEEALLESIKGIFLGNPKTEFGHAYHSILEGKYKVEKNIIITAKGYHFTKDQAAPALKYRQEHPHIVSEVNVSKIYDTSFFPIQVSGRVDALEGLFIRDGKTKFRSVNWQEYSNSSQWRFYLDMINADVFYYDVFEIKGFKDDATMADKFFPHVQVLQSETFECIRYDGMTEEVVSLLNLFLEYITNRNLFEFLKPALITESILT